MRGGRKSHLQKTKDTAQEIIPNLPKPTAHGYRPYVSLLCSTPKLTVRLVLPSKTKPAIRTTRHTSRLDVVLDDESTEIQYRSDQGTSIEYS